MGIIKRFGKVKWVDVESVYRMSEAEAKAFVVISKTQIEQHERDIEDIKALIAKVKVVHKLKKDKDGYYVHEVDRTKMIGGE